MTLQKILGSKEKISNISVILLLVLAFVSISNFVFFIYLANSTGPIPLTTENYKTLFLIRLVYQVFIFLLSILFIYFLYFNQRSKFLNTKVLYKALVILFIIFMNLPLFISLSQVAVINKGPITIESTKIKLGSESIRKTKALTRDYRKYLLINDKKLYISAQTYNTLHCTKGSDESVWIIDCDSDFKIIYLDYQEGLIEIIQLI
jgi:hypothetical protein